MLLYLERLFKLTYFKLHLLNDTFQQNMRGIVFCFVVIIIIIIISDVLHMPLHNTERNSNRGKRDNSVILIPFFNNAYFIF